MSLIKYKRNILGSYVYLCNALNKDFRSLNVVKQNYFDSLVL